MKNFTRIKNRKFNDRNGEIFGDFIIQNTIKARVGINYECKCRKCGYIKILYGSNYCAKEGLRCSKCRYNDVLGKKFGFLTIISIIKKSNYYSTKYEASCICGRTIAVNRRSLITSKKNSCGCNGLKTFDIIAGRSYGGYRWSANKRGYVFDITYAEFKNIIIKECYYCGASPKRKLFDDAKDIAQFRKKERYILMVSIGWITKGDIQKIM